MKSIHLFLIAGGRKKSNPKTANATVQKPSHIKILSCSCNAIWIMQSLNTH